jgi:Ribbon-helix-helix protein, copG family
MKRTTIYLDPDLEVLLKLEAMRRKQPMAELLREALRSYLSSVPRKVPPGAGAFDSGRTDTASRVEEVLGELGFGGNHP